MLQRIPTWERRSFSRFLTRPKSSAHGKIMFNSTMNSPESARVRSCTNMMKKNVKKHDGGDAAWLHRRRVAVGDPRGARLHYKSVFTSASLTGLTADGHVLSCHLRNECINHRLF